VPIEIRTIASVIPAFVSALIALAVGVYAVHGAFTQTGVVG
jgi:hypothetical protein